MTQELRKFIAPEFVFGSGSRKLLGQYLMNFGAEHAMIITDRNIRGFSWFNDILAEVETNYVIYDDVTPNPRDHQVHKGADLYLESGCDILVAIGGGSVIDCAKGIGVVVENSGTIDQYEGVDQIPVPLPILICIPTTSGSAADVSQFAIINNTQEDYKMVLASKILVPDLALVDPEVTLTCDFDLTVDTALDALVHAVEAYVSNASSFMTDMHALKAIELIVAYLPFLSSDLNSIAYRSQIMEACLHAGLAFSNASLGLIHAMAHALGGRYDLVHGEVNGILLAPIVSHNYPAAKERYDQIHEMIERITGEFYEEVTASIMGFIKNIRPNHLLHEIHSGAMDFEALADFVLKDPCIVTNPANVTKEDVVRLYEKIF